MIDTLDEGRARVVAPAVVNGPGFPGFVPSADERALFDDLVSVADAVAIAIADRFEDIGSPPMVAASLSAHLLVRAAWKFAAITRIAVDDIDPASDNFIALATDVARGIWFDTDAIRADYARLATAEGGDL